MFCSYRAGMRCWSSASSYGNLTNSPTLLHWLIEIDRYLFLAINGWAGTEPLLDSLMLFLSGKWSAIPLYAFLAYLLYKVYGVRQFALIALGVTVLVILTDQGSVHLFKNVFQRLRPCHDATLMEQVRLVNAHCGGQFGFVSSHAANTFGLATFVVLLLRQFHWPLPMLLFVWAGLVGCSRLFLGVHFPGDVIFGALFGSMVGWAMGALTLRLSRLI